MSVVSRLKEFSSFIVMDVLEKAHDLEKRGIDVIHLEVGEPDFDTPACIKEAICTAMDEGHTHYTHSLGILELREAICDHYYKKYAVDVTPDQILVCSGTSPAMLIMFSVLLEKGDEVIISNPHYACYPNFVRFLDANPVMVDVFEEDGFQYHPDAIRKKINRKTSAIIINSPSNPTGNLLSAERMAEIAEFSPYILSDEIYHGLVYEGKEHSILEFTDHAFVLNGFSKLFAMTGLRLGYVIAPKDFIRPMQKVQQNFFISANSLIQKAGLAALTKAGNDIENMKNTYNQRRRFMIDRLKQMGLGIKVEPTGAFYVFANTRHISNNSYKLAFDILQKAHVGVSPGIDFGSNGEGFLRFSYANSLENISEGLKRIEQFFKES